MKAVNKNTHIIHYVVRKDDKVKFYRNDSGYYSMTPLKDENGEDCLVYQYTLERLLSTGEFEIPFGEHF